MYWAFFFLFLMIVSLFVLGYCWLKHPEDLFGDHDN